VLIEIDSHQPMSTVEDKKAAVAPIGGPTVAPRRGRGMRGPRRSRGRGRGRGYVGRGGKNLPTIDERTAQVKKIESTEPVIPVPGAPSIEKLSTMMEDMYPVSIHLRTPYINVGLDVYGYGSIIEKTYEAIVENDSHIEDLCSYDEFVLVMGWLLARRVLSVRNHIFQDLNVSELLFDALPTTTPVPGPIAAALDSIGCVRAPSGSVVVPSIPLPKIDVRDNWQRGQFPTTFETSYLGEPERKYHNNMFPFWYFKRKIMFEWDEGPEFKETALDTYNPYADVDVKVDAPLTRKHLIPIIRNTGKKTTKKRYSQVFPKFSEEQSILGSVCFNGTILGSYLSFCERGQKYMRFSTVKKDTSGTGAMLGWVAHDGRSLSTPQFKVFSSFLVNHSDMHGVRIFKWRRYVDTDHDAVGGSTGFAFQQDASELRVINREISPIKNDFLLVRQFVRRFSVTSNR